ncbi:uncharacterized protein LDX57_009901 [Aspergillus melleus]|uniref:uncharacterized protein n=1 Tax=Aspergillus melleus TaxID=138277 RepID=UPI001E8E6525|nr:uncharacterized protein LDX57_009901 [Aspergillus melleus]KAH8432262.1 hypothetical protein LDX57_009901 [Aspergillus melleus]
MAGEGETSLELNFEATSDRRTSSLSDLRKTVRQTREERLRDGRRTQGKARVENSDQRIAEEEEKGSFSVTSDDLGMKK